MQGCPILHAEQHVKELMYMIKFYIHYLEKYFQDVPSCR